MAAMNLVCKFGPTEQHEDGVESNLHMADWNRGLPTWRYADLTFRSEYLVDVIRHATLHGLKDEVLYLLRYDTAQNSIKETIEGSDEDYATIIRCGATHMEVSGKLHRTYPGVFSDGDLVKRVERAVLKVFELLLNDDDEVVPRLDAVPR